ncbi:hypothetical protein ABPG73_000922 [Tetrahymena malaccensis]
MSLDQGWDNFATAVRATYTHINAVAILDNNSLSTLGQSNGQFSLSNNDKKPFRDLLTCNQSYNQFVTVFNQKYKIGNCLPQVGIALQNNQLCMRILKLNQITLVCTGLQANACNQCVDAKTYLQDQGY